MTARRRTLGALAAGPILMAIASACSPDRGTGGGILARWAQEDASELFGPDSLLSDDEPGSPKACLVRPDPSRPDLEELACPADPAEPPLRLELRVRGANLASMRLLSAPDAFEVARATAESIDGSEATYTFFVQSSTRFDRDVDGWIVRPAGAAAGALSGATLRVTRRLANESVRKRAVAKAWKLDAADSWRTGFPALPGDSIAWRPGVQARHAQLETAIFAARGSLRYRLTLDREGGPLELLRGEIVAPEGQPTAWRKLIAELRLDGPAEQLRFEVASGDSASWGGWAEPILVDPEANDERPDLVVISLDTVRADRLTPYGTAHDRTPFLAELSRNRAATFSFAVTPSTWTLPAHVSLFTGLEAFRHGVFDDDNVLSGAVTLASALRRSGYRTIAVTAGGYLHPRFGFANGFDSYSCLPFERDPYRELELGVDRLAAELGRSHPTPTFVFFHTYEAHAPNRFRDSARSAPEVLGRLGELVAADGFYGEPGFDLRDSSDRAVRRAGPEDSSLVTEIYDDALAHLDRQLRRLFDLLSSALRLDRAMVVVTSDHGESLGELGRMSHTWLDRANLRVPLFVVWPDRFGAGRAFDQLVSLVDVNATVLEAAGLGALPGSDGIPVRARLEGGKPIRARAFSYVASNNHGLALIEADGRTLIRIDSAWAHAPKRTRWIDPAADPSESMDALDPDSRAARLSEIASKTLANRLPGLRWQIENSTDREVVLELRHPSLFPNAVKMAEVAFELEWIRPGRARARLGPRQRAEWILLDANPGRVDLEGMVTFSDIGKRIPIAIHRPSDPGERVRVTLSPAGRALTRSEATLPGELAFVLWWQATNISERAVDHWELDLELRRSMEALGYLN